MMSSRDSRGGQALSVALCAVACWASAGAAWLYLATQRKRRSRDRSDCPASFVRVIQPEDYQAANPPWLVAASKRQGAGADAPDAALPPPVRGAVDELRQHFAAAVTAEGGPEALLGRRCRHLFMLEPGTTYLNHGSYGAALHLAVQAQRYFQDRLEAQPVRFMETEALEGLRRAQATLARLVGADPSDLVLVPNATTAANTVLRAVPLCPGDLILIASTTYPAVRSAAARVAGRRGAALLEVDLWGALEEPGEVVRRYQAALAAGRGRVRLAVVDHVASSPPAHLPVAALCALCSAHGALSLVDGAHAVGALPLRLPRLGADFYTSNAHKWLCCGKGVAFLWAARRRQPSLLPLVTSHGFGLGFQGEFLWSGTADPTAAMALPTAVAVMQAMEPAASAYRAALLRRAVALLTERWGTAATIGPQAAEAVMAAVEMPALGGRPPTPQLAAEVHAALRATYGIEVPVGCAGGRLWCRVSAQVYNELPDYQRLAEAVEQLAASGGPAAAAADGGLAE